MARSELAVLALVLGGCDAVFGVTGDIEPCELGSFEDAAGTDIVAANEFSIDSEAALGIVVHEGLAFELDVASATLRPVDLGIYTQTSLALTPEGDALFYTPIIEPPALHGALRGDADAWALGATVPRGTFAGTPSAVLFGPRRVLVKLRDTASDIQEYENVGGVWTAVGEPQPVQGLHAPNLAPNGLTMVYVGEHEGVPAVFAAQRASVDEWFGEPRLLRTAPATNAQLIGQCTQLYTTENLMLRRFTR